MYKSEVFRLPKMAFGSMEVSKITQVVPTFGKMETEWHILTKMWVFNQSYSLP